MKTIEKEVVELISKHGNIRKSSKGNYIANCPFCNHDSLGIILNATGSLFKCFTPDCLSSGDFGQLKAGYEIRQSLSEA